MTKRRLNSLLAVLSAILLAFSSILASNAQSGIYIRPGSSSLSAPVTNQTWLFNSLTGQIYVWNGASFLQISPPQSNLVASVAPTASNDNTQGYTIGSLWFDTVTDSFYIATSVVTSSAVWVLVSSNGINVGLIPQLLFAASSTGDYFPSSVIPAIPGSGFTTTLPAATGYVNGNMVTTASAGHTYTASMWTYDFVDTTGLIHHYVQSPSTLPPTPANQLLLYLVEANGSVITSIVPYFALPGQLRNFMIAPPGTSGYVLQSDSTNPLGQSYQMLLPGYLSNAGAVAGNTLQLNGGSWTPQTLDPTGGGTGSIVVPTNGQIPVGSTSGLSYAPANITPGADILVTNGSNTLAIGVGAATTPVLTPAVGAGSGATATSSGNDFAGVLTLTTGTGNTSSSLQVTLVQSASFGAGPVAVTLTPANTAAAVLTGATQVIANPTSTGYTITSGGSALTASTAYAWNYIVHN